jgi:hypothetical protein
MNKLKQPISSIYIFLVILCLAGCNDKLDLYPETQLTEGLFYNTEVEMIQASNDVYRQLCNIYNQNGIADLFGERFSDNVCTILIGGENSYNEDIHNHTVKSDNGYILAAWRTAYNAIFIMNNILTRLENTDIEFSSPTIKQRLTAETLFARSLIYFLLVQAWGDVPFPLKVLSIEESYTYLREKKEVIYAQIVNDLLLCKTGLPEVYTGSDVGRITNYAASAVLAKVYLVTGDKASAQTELKRIIDSNRYSLDANGDGKTDVDDYKYLFEAGTKNCKESVFEIQYLAGINNVNSEHQQAYTPFLHSFHLPGISATNRGGGRNTPDPDIIAAYETGDPRKDITIIMGFTDESVGIWVDHPYTNKYYDPNWQNPGQNVEAIRYADILLLYSEVTGDPSYLNQVRNRVGLPLYGEADYPSRYNTLALAIEHERRVELAFEFHRFFDLKRTGRALDVFNSKGYKITEDDLLFPIPLAEVDINPELEQNPGY